MPVRELNPIMAMLARESRGYTQSGLARGSGVAQGTISKLENGEIQPSIDIVQTIANFLDYPLELFFEEETFRNLPISFYRKRLTVGSNALKKLTAQVNLQRLHIRKLLRSAEIPEIGFTRLDVSDTDGNIERAAKEIRISWHVPPGPIKNVTELLESAGIVILKCDFGTVKVDGLSIFDPADDLNPIIFINSSSPGDRRRFTLCHELAHILFHHHRPALALESDIEAEANRFAAELLLPSKEVRPHLHQITLKKLISLKPYWRVSMASLLTKAYDLGLLSERQKRHLWMQMGKYGYRVKEPFPIEPEEPSLIVELIRFHLESLGYSEKELSHTLRLRESEFQRQYLGATRPNLRVLSPTLKIRNA